MYVCMKDAKFEVGSGEGQEMWHSFKHMKLTLRDMIQV